MQKHIFFYLLLLTLISCGGGSSNEEDTSGSHIVSDTWVAKQPDYNGSRDTFEITPHNASAVALEVISLLDYLNLITYGDEYAWLFFIRDEQLSPVANEITCESGSVKSEEVTANSKLEVTYNKCVTDGIEIDGTVRAMYAATNGTVTVIPNLTFKDMSTQSIESLSGYLKLDDSDDAIYHLMITDAQGQQILFDGFRVEPNFYMMNGLIYSGDIYISNRGKLTIATNEAHSGEFYTNSITISANVDLQIHARLQHDLEVSLAEHIPVIIPLTNIPESLFSPNNIAPVAIITTEKNSVDRASELYLSAVDSIDENYEPLAFHWEVVAQPEESNVSLSQSQIATFKADLPGDYRIKLKVEDPSGAVSSTERVITVLQNIPQGNISSTLSEHYISESFNATVNIENDEYDGPYTYALKYGPASMQVSPEGDIHWDAAIANFGVSTEVNYAVHVSNQDKSNVIEGSITLKPSSHIDIDRRDSITSIDWLDTIKVEGNQADRIYFKGKVLTKLVINGENLALEDVVFMNETINAEVSYQAVSDVDSDGVDDYWFSYVDIHSEDYLISWRNGNTGVVTEFIRYEDALNDRINFQMLDYNLDGSLDLFVLLGGYSTQIIDVESKEEIVTLTNSFDADYQQACDINNDGYIDLIYRNRVVDLKNDAAIFESIYPFRAIDLGGNSGCALTYKNDNSQLVLHTLHNDLVSEIFDLTMFKDESYSINVGNFSGGVAQELLIKGYVETQDVMLDEKLFLIENIGAEDSSYREIINNGGDLREFAKGVTADLNGDGYDDIINDTKKGSVINGASFDKQYSSPFLGGSMRHIDDWVDDKLALNSTYNWLAKSEFGDVMEYSQIDSELSITKIEEGNIFVYSNPQPTSDNPISRDYIVKRDFYGNESWGHELDNLTHSLIKSIELLDNGILVVATSDEEIFLKAQSGEEIFRIQVKAMFGGPQFVYFSTPTADYFASMRSQSILKMTNGAIEKIESDTINEILAESTNYSFVQLDSDEAPELLVYAVSKETYSVIDLHSGEQQAYSSLYDGIVPKHGSFGWNTLMQCFPWDTQCRNLISNKIKNDGFEVVDKLTGTVIWRSPRFGRDITDLKVRQDINGVKSAVNFEQGQLYIFN